MADGSTVAMGSLYDLLLDYVDTAMAHDSNFEIARQLVENYGRLAGMTLREMAELCFVSQATFSRFCRFLGFSDFAEFKESLDGANYLLGDDYTRAFLDELSLDEGAARRSFRTSVVDLLAQTLEGEEFDRMPEILEAIEGAERVVFFSHHFLLHLGRYLQSKMLLADRFVELYQSYEHQLEAAQSLGPNDVVIVCTVTGTFFAHYGQVVREIFASGAQVIAITQNRQALHINRVDYLLPCGNTNDNDMGKYAALITIDALAMSYMNRKRSQRTHDELSR